MKKIKDPILLGIVAGLTGNLFKNLGSLVNLRLGLVDESYATLAGSLFQKKRDSREGTGNIVGWLTDAAMGAGLGVGYIYILKFTGKDHCLLKGVGYGHGAWTLLLGGANKAMSAGLWPQKPQEVLSHYAAHTLYGIGLALVATAFADKDLFDKEDIELVHEDFPAEQYEHAEYHWMNRR